MQFLTRPLDIEFEYSEDVPLKSHELAVRHALLQLDWQQTHHLAEAWLQGLLDLGGDQKGCRCHQIHVWHTSGLLLRDDLDVAISDRHRELEGLKLILFLFPQEINQ